MDLKSNPRWILEAQRLLLTEAAKLSGKVVADEWDQKGSSEKKRRQDVQHFVKHLIVENKKDAAT